MGNALIDECTSQGIRQCLTGLRLTYDGVTGMKSETHFGLHPLGKVPCLGSPDGFCLAESEVHALRHSHPCHKSAGALCYVFAMMLWRTDSDCMFDQLAEQSTCKDRTATTPYAS